MTACDGSFSNFLENIAQCDGCDGCDGSRMWVMPSSNYTNNSGSDMMMLWRKSRSEYTNFNNNTHIEKASQPSHPNIRAQYSVTAILEPSHPSHEWRQRNYNTSWAKNKNKRNCSVALDSATATAEPVNATIVAMTNHSPNTKKVSSGRRGGIETHNRYTNYSPSNVDDEEEPPLTEYEEQYVKVHEEPQPSYHSVVSKNNEVIIETGLDFILSHFEDPLFPRKISTYKSNNKQFLVRTREEVIDAFIVSNFVDCRINAYPYLTDYIGIQRYKPNFIFIDLDKNNFKSERSFKNALSNTLKNIKNKLDSNAYPTVIETGGGYHVYQPVFCPTALENVIQFSGFDKPSEQFLRFAKDYLSNGKADKLNNPSFKSCLLRIPGSINSKYDTKVKIVQKWNGLTPTIPREFVEEFRTYLIQKKIDEATQRQKFLSMRNKNCHASNSKYINYYEWIDSKVLANPFTDCRKIIVDLILAPYLINIKKMSYNESYQIIKGWLDKCNSLKKLDNYSNFVNYRIHSALKAATQKGIGPMNLYKIKTDRRYNTNLYLLILQK